MSARFVRDLTRSVRMVSSRAEPITTPTVVGLVATIAITDVAANVVLPDAAKLPAKLVIAAAYLAWARRAARLSWTELGLGRSEIGSGLRWGTAALAIVAGVIVFLAAVSQSQFENSSVAHDSTAVRFLEPLVLIPLQTVLFEEVIFRGVLLGVLLRWTKQGYAIGASAIVFGLWHLPPALHDASGNGFVGGLGVVVGTITFTTFAGLIFAWLRLRSGSLVAPAMAHVASNSIAYIAAVVALQ
jgi:membrane protease YdiL (CAAX protease family)